MVVIDFSSTKCVVNILWDGIIDVPPTWVLIRAGFGIDLILLVLIILTEKEDPDSLEEFCVYIYRCIEAERCRESGTPLTSTP